MKKYPILLLVLVCAYTSCAEEASNLTAPGVSKIIHFDGALPHTTGRSPEIDYSYDLSRESFELFVPTNHPDKESFGVFVFIDSQNETPVPKEWVSVMERDKLICLIPQNVGNDQTPARRMGLTLIGILKLKEKYRIDPKRVFSSGFSGGARCSLHLAFLHSDVIAGNISICGADFHEPVQKVKAVSVENYGLWPVDAECVARAKKTVRFVFITGNKDFRYGNIMDIFEGGFVKQHFKATVIDVPGMEHQLCAPKILQNGISFLENKD